MTRLILEIAQGINPTLHFRMNAISALQEAAEIFIVQMVQGANLLALHRKHATIELGDIQLFWHLMECHNFFSMKRDFAN